MEKNSRSSTPYQAMKWLAEQLAKGENPFKDLDTRVHWLGRGYDHLSSRLEWLNSQGYVHTEDLEEGELTQIVVTVTPEGLKAVDEWRVTVAEQDTINAIIKLQANSAAMHKKVEQLQKVLANFKNRT